MPMTFYPHPDDAQKGSVDERIEMLMDSADRFRAAILDLASKTDTTTVTVKKISTPRDQKAAFNWDEIASVLRQVRELPESAREDRGRKAVLLNKLAEIYEVLRAAKMPKLEAVRLALISEANQLAGGSKLGGVA